MSLDEKAWQAVRSRIALAARRAGRDPASIGVLAVSKGQPAAAVRAAYTLGERALQFAGINRIASGVKLALIGRNLVTWTKYTGFDPDVTAGGDFNFRVDGFRYPNFRTITGQVELTF